MKSEDYRSYLVECVKTAGAIIIDMAEDIVGETFPITNLALEISFDQENLSIPEITITKMHLPDNETLDRLLDNRVEKIKRRIKMINLKEMFKNQGIDNIDIGEVSDGYHTFNSLYHQRLILFAALVNTYSDISWKTKRHEDGEECFGGGWFLVGINTPEGPYTYHYELKDWDLFNCEELDRAPEWDGHTDEDVKRLLSLPCARFRTF